MRAGGEGLEVGRRSDWKYPRRVELETKWEFIVGHIRTALDLFNIILLNR